MDEDLLRKINENVQSNAKRYWYRSWLIQKFYSDEILCEAANDAGGHITLGFTNTRESLVDSAVVCLTRGLLDLGDQSLSLARLYPTVRINVEAKNYARRAAEEVEARRILIAKYYDGQDSNGSFERLWEETRENYNRFAQREEVVRARNLRNTIVAHSLTEVNVEEATYGDLYSIRDFLVEIMNSFHGVMAGLGNHRYVAWGPYANECERAAIGLGNVIQRGLEG